MNTNEQRKNPGLARYVLAILAMGAAVVFIGPQLDRLSAKTTPAASAVVFQAIERQGAAQLQIADVIRPIRLTDKLPGHFASGRPIAVKAPDAWDSPENLARTDRFYEKEDARIAAAKEALYAMAKEAAQAQ